jgi:hypothetical protein
MDCILAKILVTIAMFDAGILLDQSWEEGPGYSPPLAVERENAKLNIEVHGDLFSGFRLGLVGHE